MTKDKLPNDAAIISLGCIVLLATALVLIYLPYDIIEKTDSISLQQEGVALYISTGNLYKGFFSEPCETALFIFRDGTFFTFTTQDRDRINAPPAQIYDYLVNKNKQSISDAVFIIHHHSAPALFSDGDKRFYQYMKDKGFHGYFIIYYTFSGKVRIWEEGE